MFRLVPCCVFVIMLTVIAGCRVCSSPYDYCGPVDNIGGNGCSSCGGSSCDPLYRSGSVLNGYHGGRHYGSYSGVAQAQPYNDPDYYNYQSPSNGKKAVPQSTSRPINQQQQPTRAREVIPPPAPIPPQSSIQIPPAPLTRDVLLQQERGAVDAKLIDVQDTVVSPTSGSARSNSKKSAIKQVSYEEVAW